MLNLFTSQLFLTCIVAWILAHLFKLIIALIKSKNYRSIKQFFDSGGFPSGHTTLVTTLFFSLGLSQGWTAQITTVTGVFAIIVIYDALNIRFQAGLHARILNELGKMNPITGKAFKENLGHTYVEMFGGLFLGILCAVISYL